VVDIAPLGKNKFGLSAAKTTTYRDILRDQPFIEDSLRKNKIQQEVIYLRPAHVKKPIPSGATNAMKN